MDTEEVLDNRGSRYGSFDTHAATSQEIKNVIKGNFNRTHEYSYDELPAFLRESIEMIAHKLGRVANGDPMYDDNFVDIAGYAELAVKYLRKRADESTKYEPSPL